MATADASLSRFDAGASPGGRTVSPVQRLWKRELDVYPENGPRFLSLGIVVLTTVVLYYQLYLAGAVATQILGGLHMSFLYYVNISVVGYVAGAAASVIAGFADRYGRANIVAGGLLVTGVLSLVALPASNTKLEFALVFIAIGFVEGIILVATPALVRDFSPQLGRASAMGFWTLGPVLGSLVVSLVTTQTLSSHPTWQSQYRICGVVGIVVFVIAAVGLRELAPRMRDQLMVSHNDRLLVEARARGMSEEELAPKKPFRQMLKVDVIGSAFAISVFLIIYYLAVGFFPIFFETNFGYTATKANEIGNYFWAADAIGLVAIGLLSDYLKVRKPFMIVGGVLAIIFTSMFAIASTHTPGTAHPTSYNHFIVLLTLLSLSLGVAYAPWMASFTETVEKHNPALTATGLAVWGLIIRLVIAVSVFFVPHVVNTVTPLITKGPVVQAIVATPVKTAAGNTTIGAVAAAAQANPTVVAKVQSIVATDGPLIAALQANPVVATAIAQAQAAGVTPTADQLAQLKAVLGDQAFALLIDPATGANLAYLSTTAPAALGAANFAALSDPTVVSALGTLAAEAPAVQKAAVDSPKQWRSYFWISVGGEVLFLPLVFLMAGYWSPKRARKEAADHAAYVDRELTALQNA